MPPEYSAMRGGYMQYTISVHVDLANGGRAHVESGRDTRYVFKLLGQERAWAVDGSDVGYETFAQAVSAAVELAVEALPDAS